MIKKGLSYLLIAIVLLSVTTIGVSAQDDSVYLEPASSTVNAGETTDVAIWISTTGFQGGQINLTYDPSVVNITGFVNESDFPIWYWNSESDGEEWILFAANYSPDLPLEGEYKIGTLTVEGISPGTSELGFGDNSSIFDDHGSETEVSWVGGGVECRAGGFGVTRNLPEYALPNTTINVVVNFTPDEDFTAVGLADTAPAGFIVEVDKDWCTPEADQDNLDDTTAQYIWYELDAATSTTALYKVNLTGVTEGTYTFNGTLSYRDETGVKHTVSVGGDYELEVIAGIPINGTIYEVNDYAGTITNATVILTQDGSPIETTTSDNSGKYQLFAPVIGDYTIEVSKTGYATESQDVSLTTQEAITIDFRYDSGLIPEDPEFDYVLDCIYLWKGEGKLSFDKMLDIIYYWKT